MTKKKIAEYRDVEELRAELSRLKGQKFTLDCGHHVTFGEYLGNSVIFYNGKIPKIICTECGY